VDDIVGELIEADIQSLSRGRGVSKKSGLIQGAQKNLMGSEIYKEQKKRIQVWGGVLSVEADTQKGGKGALRVGVSSKSGFSNGQAE